MSNQTKRDSLPILKDRVSLTPELMNARVFIESCGKGETITAENTGRSGGAGQTSPLQAHATDAYPKATHYTVFREAAFNPRSNPKTGLPVLVDIKEKLPLSTTYTDLLFEARQADFYELKIKPQEREIVVFSQRVML